MPRKKQKMPTGVSHGPDDGRYYIRWRHGGEEHKFLIEAPSAKAAAEERERRIHGQVAPAGRMTVEAVVAEFDRRKTRRHTTRNQDLVCLRRLIEDLGSRDFRSVGPTELQQWLRDLRQRNGAPYSPVTQRGFRRAVRALWGWAQDEQIVTSNVARQLQVEHGKPVTGPAPSEPKRHMTVDELRAVYAWLRVHADPIHDGLLRAQFRLGLRIGEAVCLRRDLIDWDTGAVVIDRALSQGEIGPTKTGKQTQKYLSVQGRAEMRYHIERIDDYGSGYVWTRPRPHRAKHPMVTVEHVGDTFSRALQATRVELAPRTTTHALRHAWYAIARGYMEILSEADVAELLGHTAATTKGYYASGPGLMAKRIAEYMETVVFSG